MSDEEDHEEEFGDGVESDDLKAAKAETERVKRALKAEREKHKETRQKLQQFEGVDPDSIHERLDRLDELEAASDESGNAEEKLQKLVQARLDRERKPLQRNYERTLNELNELKEKYQATTADLQRRDIHEVVRKALVDEKGGSRIVPTAMDDVLSLAERHFEVIEGEVRTRDGVGVTPDLQPGDWIGEILQSRPHMVPTAKGAGARGTQQGSSQGTGENPFSLKNGNLTEAMRITREDPGRAKILQQQAQQSGG